MKIKMGLFAENLSAAEQAATGPLANKLRWGKRFVNTAGRGLNAVDVGMTRALEPMFRPGGEFAAGVGNVAGEAYTSVAQHPRLLKALGVMAPLGVVYQNQGMEQLTPMFNQAMQEGRTVYANDQEFLRKKLAVAREKTAAPNNLVNFFLGMANSGAKDAGNPIGRGLAGLIDPMQMGAAPGYFGGGRSGAAGMTFAGLGGQAAGNALSGIKDMVSPAAGTAGYQINRWMNPVTDRVKADELLATSFLNNLGGEAAKGLVGLLKDMAGKAVAGMTQGPVHARMLDSLAANDPILARANPDELLNVYHTVAKFAPTLATDENAVRSIMRQVATQGTEGIDYATIANIAKAEKDITGGGK